METKDTRIRVLIADDHQMMLDGLRSLLSAEADIVISAEASNGAEVLDKLKYTAIDVAVVDIDMPVLAGYDTVIRIKELYPHIKILILSFHKDEKNIGKLLTAGIDGYIIKDRGSDELVKAIRTVASGRDYFDTEVNRISRKSLLKKHSGIDKAAQLTSREIEVLKLLAHSFTSREIGDRLHISESTVETHKKNAIEKLGLPSARHLKTYAVENYRQQ